MHPPPSLSPAVGPRLLGFWDLVVPQQRNQGTEANQRGTGDAGEGRSDTSASRDASSSSSAAIAAWSSATRASCSAHTFCRASACKDQHGGSGISPQPGLPGLARPCRVKGSVTLDSSASLAWSPCTTCTACSSVEYRAFWWWSCGEGSNAGCLANHAELAHTSGSEAACSALQASCCCSSFLSD